MTLLRVNRPPITVTVLVPANSRETRAADQLGLADGEQFGAFIESTQPIVVEHAYVLERRRPVLGRWLQRNQHQDSLAWTSTGEILARKADRGRCQRGGGNDEQPPRVARAQPVYERCAVLLEDRELQ